ncbi:hypothetical protein FLAG1_11676 [Fusarium langsethiae]|uniref:Uncharacterized protein n=1 Tax=Fusarium langsethiae TaxID=179993 RepID=A0A0M9EM85_FUSLA|nr:hypothetical protein FLAG1_11676 [Fusarium langsethiae]
MKDQLPTYQEALSVSASNSNELLLVRLEVWHFFDLGRSPILNHQFATSFRQSNLDHWAVREVQVTEPHDRASRDTFVPVQANRPGAGVPIFSQKRNQTTLDESGSSQRTRRPEKPGQLDEIDAIEVLLSTATKALSALSFIVDFFIMMHAEQTNQSQFTSIPTSDATIVFGLAELFSSIQRIAPLVNELQQAYERSMTLAAVDQPERLNAWQQATHPFLQHQTGFSRIATTLERIKRGEAVTPQALYTAVQDFHASSLEFTRVRSRLNSHLATELETYKLMEKLPKTFTGAGVVGVGTGAILLASNPAGWAVAAAAILGLGILSAATGGYQWTKVSKKRKAIRKGDAEKRAFLESFAVDVDALQYQGYRESLVMSGIDKVLKYYNDLTTDFHQMVEHCGLRIDIAETNQR